MKGSSTSFLIREMEIKNKMMNHLIPVRMAIRKISTNNKCWKECGERDTLLYCWWECKSVQLLWKIVQMLLKKLERELPYDPAIPLMGIYSEMMKLSIWKNIRTIIFIAALFTIARTWKQPKFSLTDEWIKKIWYTYTMEYYSPIKKNELAPLVATQIDPESIILSELNQAKTNIAWYHLYVES